MARVKRLFAGGLVLACLLTACSNSELGESTIPESNQTSELASEPDVTQSEETTPSNEALYPLVPDSRTVYPVQDFDSDEANKPYNQVGNVNENGLNIRDTDQQPGMSARQGQYTYYIHYGAVFRIRDGEKEAQCLLSPNEREGALANDGQISGLNVIGEYIYYVNNSGDILYRFSMKEDAVPQPITRAYFYIVIEDMIYILYTGVPYTLTALSVNEPENVKMLVEANRREQLNGLAYADGYLYFTFRDVQEDKESLIKRIRPDGTGLETVYAGDVTELCNVVDSWLYFYKENATSNGKEDILVRYHIDTGKEETLLPQYRIAIVSADGMVYYQADHYEDDGFSKTLYSLNPETMVEIILYEDVDISEGFGLSGDYLFAIYGRNGTTCMRVERKHNGKIDTAYFDKSNLSSNWKPYPEYDIQPYDEAVNS